MSKCIRCKKGGFFLKVNKDSICKECERLTIMEIEEKLLRSKIDSSNKEIENIELSLGNLKKNRDAVYKKIFLEAKTAALLEVSEKLEEENKNLILVSKNVEDATVGLNLLQDKVLQSEKAITLNANKLKKLQTTFKSLQYSTKKYFDSEAFSREILDDESSLDAEDLLSTTIKMKFHHMDIRELRKQFNQNSKLIQELLIRYKDRYTTKANIAIYRLMVIALEAELQNVLYNLSYSKYEKAIKDVVSISEKYKKIATDGNQSIASTITKFIGELEYFFIESVKIEYEYYIQKERIKEEQKAIRDQMKQEAAERRILEEQRKKIEQEESKYLVEINNINEQIINATDVNIIKMLEERIEKVRLHLDEVEKKKDEIINLQNGKAGYIYIISNLGSLGENIFKVGMTRRLNPQDRVDELGDASVPFKFDVHSFIFSNSAPTLENDLHRKLHDKRVNKINLRKEFFYTSIDELEELVYSLEPTAEFNRTMLAEQYTQSMAVDFIPLEVEVVDVETEDEGQE